MVNFIFGGIHLHLRIFREIENLIFGGISPYLRECSEKTILAFFRLRDRRAGGERFGRGANRLKFPPRISRPL